MTDADTLIDVLHMNMDKNLKNIQIYTSEKNAFKKGTEPAWSHKVYTQAVEGVKGLSVTLNDCKAYKCDKQLKIPKDTVKTTNLDSGVKARVVKTATKQRKQELMLTRAPAAPLWCDLEFTVVVINLWWTSALILKAEENKEAKRECILNKQLNDFISAEKKGSSTTKHKTKKLKIVGFNNVN